MTTPGASSEDVVFDADTAARLAALLRATATDLTEQVGFRSTLATAARAEWRGRYGDQFDVRTGLCRDGAVALAEAMTTASAQVDELARQALEEQARRVAARQWFADQQSMGFFEGLWDSFTDWFAGPDVPPQFTPTVPAPVSVAVPGFVPADRA